MIGPQNYRIEWVHGIGPTQTGFSTSWTQAFNQYLNFPLSTPGQKFEASLCSNFSIV